MATLAEIKSLVVKDTEFRKSLFSDPDRTLRSRRLSLTEKELYTLKAEIKELTNSMTVRELDKFFEDTKSALGWND
jgi:hypothetical protein